GAPLPRAVGCDACNRTGYVGRAVVVESFQVTDESRAALSSGKPLAQVEPFALTSRALLPFSTYAAALLQKQIISATEVLAALHGWSAARTRRATRTSKPIGNRGMTTSRKVLA